jgi:hypothetical protein
MAADKNLPIKIFEKRKVDERKTEGMSSSTLPPWVLDFDELELRAESFLPALEASIDSFDHRESGREFIPSTLRVEIDDNAIAKSHRNDIKRVFNVGNKSNFIGFADTNDLLVKIESKSDAIKVEKNIKDYTRHRKAISSIVSVTKFEPYVDLENKDDGALKISILNFRDFELNRAVKSSFVNFCESRQLKTREANYSPEMIVFRVESPSPVVADTLSEFEAIESITFMPKYEVGLDSIEDQSQTEIKNPIKDLDYPIVGVLDSGIARNKYLEPWLLDTKFSSYPDDLVDPMHGTAVAGVLLYGDDLEGKRYSGLEGCRLFDATVFPDNKKETVYEDQLIENIREAISKNKDKIKVWNLSLGTNKECSENDFSDFGMALDSIQDIHNVLICKSVGNCRNFASGRPKGKIAVSADSVKSLVVGSLAHKKSANDLAEINYPSPFSRIGYGPANIIKPDLVSYGGNAGLNESGITTTGVKSFDPNGNIVSVIGTSFSTPRITGLLSSLEFNLTEDFNPLLLKALAIHSAKYPKGIQMPIYDRIKQMGFGVPGEVDDIIFNDPYEITLILQDTLVKGEFMEILEFPFPENLINSGFYYGDLKVTMVSSPILREKQGSEYCQSNLDIHFGTYDRVKDRDITKSNILNEFGPDGNKNLLPDGSYKKQFKKDLDSDFARERTLINYGKKYQPIKKYSVNLEEMTDSNKVNYLQAPKKWYLKVNGLYRDFAEMMALIDGEELSQEFCIVVTIRDNKKRFPIYNEVSQLLNNRNFTHSNIKLRQEVKVNIK